MRIPLVSMVQDLDPAPRRFLLFSAFNVVSWQCIVGQAVLTLFARHIGMPFSWVGWLQSFMPLATLVVLFTVQLVVRLGPKRIMFSGWLARNLIVGVVFLMPWAIQTWGPRAGWYVLLGSILGFCMLRALASGAWFPWLHEMVPSEQRGIYFSAEAAISQAVTVLVVLGQSAILLGRPSTERFLVIYGIGMVAGLISLMWMVRVPGGGGTVPGPGERGLFGSYRIALHDKPFLRFLVVAGLCFSSLTWFGAALIMFMRDALHIEPRIIMTYSALGAAGVLLTVRSWARFADHAGSGRAMSKTLFAHSLVALATLFVIPGTAWSRWAMLPLVFLATSFGAAFWTATNRAMLNVIQETGRVGYTSLWTIATAIAQGVTPVLVGMAIQHWHLAGFRTCFAVSAGLGTACAIASRYTVESRAPLGRSLSELLNPAFPLRTLCRIVRITVGLDESNRAGEGHAAKS